MAHLASEVYKRTVTGVFIVSITFFALYGGPFIFIPFLAMLFGLIFFVEWPQIRPSNSVYASLLLLGWILVPLLTLAWISMRTPEPFIIFFFLIAWIHDTAAYIGGKVGGKNHIMPSISPQKTWEGFISGLLGLFLTGQLTQGVIFKPFTTYSHFFPNPPTQYAFFTLSLLISVILTTGDMFESWLKRKALLKDSSSLLPGHGGILDRIDSLLFLILLFNLYLLTSLYF